MQPLFKLSSGPLLKSGLEHMARYSTHQKTIGGRPEQVYLSFDQDCKDLGRGCYLSQTQINASGSNCDYYSNYHMSNYLSQAWGQILHSSGV